MSEYLLCVQVYLYSTRWSLGLAYLEYFNASGAIAAILFIALKILNAAILYWIGALITKLISR